MQVKVLDYGFDEEKELNYVKYRVIDIDSISQKKLMDELEEETEIISGELVLTVYFEKEYFPFGSQEATIRMDDFIAREEIEMTVFLSGVLED
ncbi:DUF5750 family protein [Methanobacterium alcaliphilum]|uniref:DUF5750 family protein n=1 Tax=Methanobacterium alcaliphilum TaxID=392018 RepID=UPI00200A1047|nr:DUF5750 family protein [Methanobacterium alcaliphilum]MCK9151207.1 hypothetical protein [Methanobacterium alcaliphilum]